MADRMEEKVAWILAVHRWRIAPTIGLTLKKLSQSQRYEATDMAHAALSACHFRELVVVLKIAQMTIVFLSNNLVAAPEHDISLAADAETQLRKINALLAKVDASDG